MDLAGDSDVDDFNYYYDSDDGNKSDQSDNGIEHDDVVSSFLPKERNYTVLTENDIKQRQNDEISYISSVLSLSPSEATTLLCYYKWNVSKLHDKWFNGEETVRFTVGLFTTPTNSNSQNSLTQCQICFEDFTFDEKDQIFTANCSHNYCSTCWRTYIITAIDDLGPGCLSLRCPEPKCPAAVGLDLIRRVSLGGDYEKKYDSFVVRSYVEGRREKIKWCPAPGCENAVEFELGCGEGYDVFCLCSNAFCWNCTEEAHRPVDCETVAQWIKKNSSESENTNWILAYSKPCPKCKRPIEKNHGCNHMTCGHPCRYEFCWLCLADWRSGHYSCNRYRGGKEDGEGMSEDEKRRARAKKSLERYTHYYERWASNHKSRQKAIEDLTQMKTTHLKLLSDKVNESETQLDFIIDAWNQVVECRRVLKWSYAYGYYLPENELAKRHFFEYSQGEAETGLERLHRCVERELSENFLFVEHDELRADELRVKNAAFNEFRSKLTGLTKVTRSYFEKLVEALENGLSDVNSHPPKLPRKPKGHKRKAGSSSANAPSKVVVAGATTTTVATTPSVDPTVAGGDIGYWNCDRCTYLNPETAVSCQMCFDDGH